MSKLLSLLGGLFILIAPFHIFSQAGAYSFSTSTAPFTEVSTSATVVPAVEGDLGEADIPIGFNFEFDGTVFTTVAATSDGYLSFVPGATSTGGNNLDNGPSSRRPLVAPLWDDLDGSATSSKAAYEVTGTAPNRVFTFEWRNWEWDWNSSDSVVSFQVKLYETTNVIEFAYRWECSACINSADASIGLSGASTFLSVTGLGTPSPTASAFTEDDNIDTIVTDQVFTFTPPTCLLPTNLSISNIGSGSLDLDWSTGGASAWQISYDTTGNIPGTNLVNVTTAPPYNLTGLPTGVPIDIYVRDSCGMGDVSFWGGPVTVSLPCGPQTAPYTTNFDSFITGFDPFCWSSYTSAGSVEVSTSGTPRSGSQQLEIDGTSTTTDTLLSITPQFSDMTSGDKQVRFFAKSPSTTDTLFVGTVASLSLSATFNYIDTLVFATSAYSEIIIELNTGNGYNGTDEYIAFMHSNDNGGAIYIDDFNYELIPPCPKITAPTVLSLSTDSVKIGFSNGGSSVDVEWGPAGFGQGTGCFANAATVSNSSVVLNNSLVPGCTNPFIPNSCYDIYIRTNCTASSNGVSIWEGPIRVCTPCAVQSLPFVENFTNDLGCFTTLDSGATTDTWFWAPAGGTPNTNGDINGTGYGLVDSDDAGSVELDEYMVSPVIDASGIAGQLIIEFDQYYRMFGSTQTGDLDVWDGTQWVNVLSQQTTVGAFTNPDHQFIDVTAYANADFQVRFHFYDANFDYWWAIDNFEVHEVLCAASINLAAFSIGSDSISINWNPGDGINFGVEYGPTGFTPGSGTMVSTVDTFFTANGLTPQTSYDFYLTDTCATGFSTTLGPITMTTPCVKQAIPFTESFGTDLGCFIVTQNGGTTLDTWEWVTDLSSNTVDGSNGFALVNSDGAGIGVDMDEVLSSPIFDASSITGALILEFDQYFRRLGDTAAVDVWDGTQWVNVLKQSATTGAWGTPDHQFIDVTAYANADFQVRFHYYEANWSYYWAIDNFSLTTLSCGLASALDTGLVDSSSAVLQWVSNGTLWNIEWGPQGFSQGSGSTGNSTVIKGVSTNPYLLTGLGADSCYDFYVQDTCAGLGTGAWAGPFSFCTKPTCPAPTNLGVDPTALTINSADIYFTPGYATNFDVQYGSVGFTPGTGTNIQATNDTVTIPSLMGGTEYEFYVRDVCSATDSSSWSGPISFITAFSTNYLQDFTQSTPFAWSEATGRLRANTTFTSTTSSSWGQDNFGNTGSASQRINLYTSNQFGWIMSPSIYLDPTLNNLQVEFDVSISVYNSAAQGYLNNTDDTLAVVISTDNGLTWSNTDILWYTDENDTVIVTGEHIVVPLAGYSGYVRFGLYGGSALDDSPDNDLYIDNFEVRTPRTCTSPTALTVSNIASDSALVSWTAGDPGFINAKVFYTLGNQPASAGTVISTTNDSVYISGLTDATGYCAYVVEQCALGYSDTVGPICFTTTCLPFTAPYSEGFEGATASCWSNEFVSGTKEWTIATGSSGGAVSTAHTGTLNARFTSSSGGPYVTKFISPIIDASSLSSTELSFWYAQEVWAGDQNFLNVYYRTSPSSPWVFAWGDSSNVALWDSARVAIPSTSSTLQIAFEGVDEFGRAPVVDDVSINVPGVVCPAPTSLSATLLGCDSVELSWNSDPAALSSHLEYGPIGFTPGMGTAVSNVSSPYKLTSLSLDTEYDFYITDSCVSNAGATAGPVTFQTDSLGPVLASFTAAQIDTTLTFGTGDFDASASSGDGISFDWDFGNGTNGTGMNVQYTYTSNGTYNVTLTVTDRCGQTDDTTIVVTIGGISVVENVYEAGIDLYPNPNNGDFKVNVTNGSSAYTVEIMELSGKLVMRRTGLTPGHAETISLEDTAPGVYLVRITGDGLNATQRVIIR